MKTAQNNTKPVNKGGASYKYTPEQLDSLVTEYIAETNANGEPLLMSAFAVYASVCDDTVTNWLNSDNTGYSEPIKRLKTAALAFKNKFLYSGKNPAGAIFDLKNNHGWVDKTETVVSNSITVRLEMPQAERLASAASRLSGKQQAISDAITVESEPV